MALSRQELLELSVHYALTSGVAHFSLRECAQAIGSSHRMLNYHFGSREGLLVAIVNEIQRRQRAALVALMDEHADDAETVVRASWGRLSDPTRTHEERIFYEMYGLALRGGRGTDGLADSVTEWIEPLRRLLPDLPDRDDRARALLAVTRGLVLDLLATGDHEGTTRAAELVLRSILELDPAAAPSTGERAPSEVPGER